jgi:ribosomal protein L37AE/L43A
MGTRLRWTTILTDGVIVGGSVLFLLGVAGTDHLLFRRTPPKPTVNVLSAAYTHVRCAACGHQVPYATERVGMTCDSCGRGAAYAPHVDPLGANGGRKTGKITAFVMIGFVMLLTLSHVFVRRLSTLRRTAEEEQHQELISQCPFCERKVRYSLARAGTAWVCVQCRTAFLLPSFG